MKAIYTKVLRNTDGQRIGVEAKYRTSTGSWVKDRDNHYHHGAPEDYSHSVAAMALVYRMKLDNGMGSQMRMADGATEDERVFI